MPPELSPAGAFADLRNPSAERIVGEDRDVITSLVVDGVIQVIDLGDNGAKETK